MVQARGPWKLCPAICFFLGFLLRFTGANAAVSSSRASVLSDANIDRVIQPSNATIKACSGRQISIVLVPGADILPSQYEALGHQFSDEFLKLDVPFAAWVGIPHLPLEIAQPPSIPVVIKRITEKMDSLGMNATYTIYAGHSVGGAMLSGYVYDLAKRKDDDAALPDAVLFLASYISRKYDIENFPVPSLTIGGSMDGLCRVTRMMESFVKQSSKHNRDAPVFVIEGMNHFSVANGTPPTLVKLRDLPAEETSNKVQSKVARLLAAFTSVVVMSESSSSRSKSDSELLQQAHNETYTFLHPLEVAYSAEGFYEFKQPCSFSDEGTQTGENCEVGSQWMNFAHKAMAGLHEGVLENATINATNEFHHAYDIFPFYHPAVLSPRCFPGKKPCQIDLFAVGENRYEVLDKLDMGLTMTSATEIKAKMVSRQVILETAGYYKPNFTEYDEVDICASINKLTYDWALELADSRTCRRFEKFGEHLIMGPDLGPYNNGPGWIWSFLHWETTPEGQVIRSPTLRTDSDYFISAAAGFHFCKLLSPARAMEWIYVDGLRRHISNYTATEEKDVLRDYL